MMWKLSDSRYTATKNDQCSKVSSLSRPFQTNIGSILAAVNPYKQIAGLYDPDRVDLYSKHHIGELPPHIFAVANECYRCIWKRHDSQCVLIRWVKAICYKTMSLTCLVQGKRHLSNGVSTKPSVHPFIS